MNHIALGVITLHGNADQFHLPPDSDILRVNQIIGMCAKVVTKRRTRLSHQSRKTPAQKFNRLFQVPSASVDFRQRQAWALRQMSRDLEK
jgi:hypothetical protein